MPLDSTVRAFPSETSLPWFIPVLGVVELLLLVAPGTATLFAWDYARTNRTRCVRLARIAMVGAALSVVLHLALVFIEGDWRLPRRSTWTLAALLAVLQAFIFTMAWLATRGPRSSRPFTD